MGGNVRLRNFLYFFLIFLMGISVYLGVRKIIYLRMTPEKKIQYLLKKRGISKLNVVLFTLDTTRADHLPPYGYKEVKTPAITEMARKGVVFEQCITPAPLTLPSHSSIMTGLYPITHGIRINGALSLSDKNLTLAEVFRNKGYSTSAFIAAFVLDGRWGLKQGFQHYDDNFDLEKYKTLDLGRVQIPANQVIDKTITWLKDHMKQPFFLWIHLYDPHIPYAPPEPYLTEYSSRGMVGLYDGEIAFMDSQIGRFINWMKKKGVYKNTLFIFVGDHGEELGQHGEQTHGYFVYDAAIRVPLIIVFPEGIFKGRRIKQQVRTIDIFPTLLQILGVKIPDKTQGRSLLPLLFSKKGKNRPAYSEALAPQLQYNWAALYSLRLPPFKYIEAPKPEFYNLLKDPREVNNIIKKKWILAKKYRKKLYKIIRDSEKRAIKSETADIDSETLRKLATLGYLGVTSSREVSLQENLNLPDPKDMLDLFNMISQAAEYISEENYGKAVELLKNVVKRDPQNPQARLLLASCYTRMKKFSMAQRELEFILKKNPKDIKALITLANIVFDQGKFDDTVLIGKRILEIDKNSVQALTLIARALEAKGDLKQALNYFKKAVQVQPKLMSNRLELAKCEIGLKRYDEAERELKIINRKYPHYPTVHYHLGLIYENRGEVEKAKKEYLKEIENHGKFIPARFNYAMLIFRDNLDEYLYQLKEILKIDPKFARAYLFLARGLLYTDQDMKTIERAIHKGLSLTKDPKLKALGYYLLADLYNKFGLKEKIKPALKKAKYFESKIGGNR